MLPGARSAGPRARLFGAQGFGGRRRAAGRRHALRRMQQREPQRVHRRAALARRLGRDAVHVPAAHSTARSRGGRTHNF